MATEQPTVEESPTIEQPTTPKPVEIDTKALLDELGKIGVKKPEELINIHNASQQVGKAWNEVGTLRQQNEQLLKAMQELKSQVSQPRPHEPDYGSSTEGIDIRKVIREETGTVIDSKLQEMNRRQFEAQRAVQREYQAIIQDEDFGMVQPIWEKHVANYATQERLQSGETTLKAEYDRTVKTYLKELAIRGRTALEGVAKSTVRQPHMEGGETQSKPLPSGDQEHNKKIRQIKDDRTKGNLDSDRALEKLVKEFFPSDMFKIQPYRAVSIGD